MPRRDLILKAWMAAIWLVCLYRAITQSIVHDEALTYGLYLGAPASQIFQYFSPNHHFLNTLLMKLSVSLFGVSELSMRLPALAGAALYLAAVYRLCAREFRTGAASFLAAALLTLNPFILDFMVAARGYGMATGLWMWAFTILLQYVRKPDAHAWRHLLQAGAALSLSVWANLVFVIPAGLTTAAAWLLLRQSEPATTVEPEPVASRKKRRRKRPAPSAHDLAMQSFWRWIVIPAVCAGVLLILISPIAKATSGDFYAGAESLSESLRSLYDVSMAHGGPTRAAAQTPAIRDTLAFGVAPLLLLGALALGIQRRHRLLMLSAGTAVTSGLVLLLANLAIHLRYPLDRTGIYFFPLIALALAAIADEIGAVAYAVGLLLVIQFALEFDTRKFIVWEYDADTRNILRELAKAVPDKHPDAIRLANSWQLEPSLSFYAMKDKLTWIQPISRDPIATGADYYILMAQDRGAIDALHLKPIYTGPASGTILAAPVK